MLILQLMMGLELAPVSYSSLILFEQRGLLGGSEGKGGCSPQGGSWVTGAAGGGHRRERGLSTGFSMCQWSLQPSLQEFLTLEKCGVNQGIEG